MDALRHGRGDALTRQIGGPKKMRGSPPDPFRHLVDAAWARGYEGARPLYPPAALDWLLALPRQAQTAVDVGAGTGQLTRALAARGVETFAVEPSPAMREALQELIDSAAATGAWPGSDRVRIVDGWGEDVPLPDLHADLVVWAESFHWMNQKEALAEAARLLRPGGAAALVGNQLDVSVPWVHRLSRIMRSGDVLHLRGAPDWTADFADPQAFEFRWTWGLDLAGVAALGRTRSSYLSATHTQRLKMGQNLDWYWTEHLGFSPTEVVQLPFRTLGWAAVKSV